MKEVVKTKHDLCTGCNRCVRECPMETANVTYQDENNNIKVKIDHKKCIACGRCFSVCSHHARYYEDDTTRFFDDLSNGAQISLMAAPAIRANIPDYKRLFTYLKNLGVRKIYDVSLGADICIWAHVRHLEKNGQLPLITSPCPAIVTYCEVYRHDLLKNMSPILSPMGCLAVYMKEYEGISDAIAALTPCVAKSNEYEDTGMIHYNVTFLKILNYLEENKIELPIAETEFDHLDSGLGSLFPMPGGLKENLEFFMNKTLSVDTAEGYDVYEMLNVYANTDEKHLPRVFDVLNCQEGCNVGTACPHSINTFATRRVMDRNRASATDNHNRDYFDALHKSYDENFTFSHFTRDYRPIDISDTLITEDDINKAFELLEKTDYDKQHIDCGACGSETCRNMARRIHLGVNIPINCIVKSMEDAKRQESETIVARQQLAMVEKLHEADERLRIIIDAMPLAAHFWDDKLNLIDSNQEALKFFSLSSKENYLERYFEYMPEYQPDGTLSEEIVRQRIQQTFDDGFQRFEFMKQTPDGEPMPVEVTLVRVDYKNERIVAGYTWDLRNQKRMMQEISDNASMLKAIVSSYSGVIWCINSDNIVTLFNGIYLKNVNLTPEFLEGKTLEYIRENNIYPDVIKNIEKTYAEGSLDWISEINGRIYRSRTAPIYDNNHRAIGVVGHHDDMTEMVRLQEDLQAALSKAEGAVMALETAQHTMSSMFDSNPQVNIMLDADFNVLDFNPAAVHCMGFESREEFAAGFLKRMTECTPKFQSDGKASLSLTNRLTIAVEKGSDRFETEIRLNGITRDINVAIEKIPYNDNYALLTYIFDMTEVHEREIELMRSRQLNELQLAKLNISVRATKIGLWDLDVIKDDPMDPDNTFSCSDEFRYMLGFYNENEFSNLFSNWIGLLHPEDKPRTLDSFEKHLQDTSGNTPYDIEYRLLKNNGEYGYFHASGEAIRDENGKPVRIVGAMMDITETKTILFDTEKQRVAAEAANRAKSAFLSTMSHEIRTPMNAILGITEIQLQNEAHSPDVIDALKKIYNSGDLLLGIINDILDMSKIEAGKLELFIAEYEMASLISDTAQLNIMRIGSKSLEFEICIDENLPSILMGDELRVKQVLNNLLSNAFKYSFEGCVKLSVDKIPNDDPTDENITLVFTVCDTGQGMSKEQIDKLFDEYSRFNLEANRSTEGTGLGMSITQNLISMMDGRISVESEPNKGTTFYVYIPQKKVGTKVLGPDVTQNLRQFRTKSLTRMKRVQVTREYMPYGSVLIVDDVETNIYVTQGLMAPYGINVDTAISGFEAIDKVQAGNVYDIIFMDHMMPKMDGIQATKIIRDLGYTQPIVALTANAVTGQAEVFLSNGFDDFISKPIDLRQLNATLNRLIRDKQSPEVIEAARLQAEVGKNIPEPDGKFEIDAHLASVFIHDASKSLAALKAINNLDDSLSEEELKTFTIQVHGIKSALANIGKTELSALALRLETSAREGNLEVMASETGTFLDSLEALIQELHAKQAKDDDQTTDEYPQLLREKLKAIKSACEEYDEAAADNVLIELRKLKWSSPTRKLIASISEYLLHSDFDDAVSAIDNFCDDK